MCDSSGGMTPDLAQLTWSGARANDITKGFTMRASAFVS